MTFAHVGSTLSWDASSGILLTPNGVGNLIVLCEVTKLAQTPMLTNISSSNVTWSRLTPDFATSVAATPTGAAIWIGTVTSTSQASVTLTWSGGSEPAHWEGEVNEFSSTVGSWALDTYAGIDANGGNHAYPSLTPAGADELYVGIHYDDSGASAGSTSGYTYHVTSHGNGALYNADCSSSTQSPTWAGSEVMGGIAALIKEGSSSVTGTGAVTLKKMTVAGFESPIHIVQTVTGTGNPPLTFPSPITAGNTVILVAPGYDTSGTAFSVTGVKLDGNVVSGTVAVFNDGSTGGISSASDAGNVAYISIWVLPDCSGGETVIDYTPSGSQIGQVAYEVTGLGPFPVIDTFSSGSSISAATADSGTTGAITAAEELIVGAAMIFSGAGASAPAGFTYVNPTGDAWAGYQITKSSGGSYDWQQTGAGQPWAAAIATISAATSSGAVTLKKMTVAGSGSVKVTGTADVTLQKLNTSASGGVKVTGTADVTLKKMTAAVSGTPKIFGTAAVTLKKMTSYAFVELGQSYNVWANTIPPGTSVTAAGSRVDSLVFEVTSESELRGIAFYVDASETTLSGSSYTALLYSTTTGTSGTQLASQVGSGTFTAGAWNWIPFENVVLKPGTWYAATIVSPDLLTYIHSYWGTGPGSSGFTSGPIHVPKQADAPGTVQQGFNSSGSGYPASTNVDGSWYGIDIEVFSTPVQTLFGQASPGATVQSDATSYTLGMEFSLSQDAPLAEIWFYSASGATALPVGCAIFDLDASVIVSGTENDSPVWSGAAGSGWVRCVYDRSVILKAGTKYSVSALKDTTSNVYSATSHYWDTTGAGASGLTSGIISAPNDVSSVNGQGAFTTGGTLAVPGTSFNASNYWVDVGVVVAPATGITGTGAVTLKKMTAAASGGVKVIGTVAVTLKKMTAAASGGVKVTGTISVTLKKMTVSGSGVARITGTASVTLKKMTVSGSGHAPLLGTGAVTLKKMTAGGSGSVKVIGTGSVIMYKMVVHSTNIPIPKASSLFIFSFR